MLRSLLESQRFAALATDDHGQPFASLMAFAATEDLRHLVILTERTTRKYTNHQSNPLGWHPPPTGPHRTNPGGTRIGSATCRRESRVV